MTVLPVIARELRASARQPFTYYLRVVGVTTLLLASLLFGLHFGFEPALGSAFICGASCHALQRDLGPGRRCSLLIASAGSDAKEPWDCYS